MSEVSLSQSDHIKWFVLKKETLLFAKWIDLIKYEDRT
jgi:hypothetical protein